MHGMDSAIDEMEPDISSIRDAFVVKRLLSASHGCEAPNLTSDCMSARLLVLD